MKNASKKSEIAYAIMIGVILAGAIWWIVGGWIIPIVFCGFDNDEQCNFGLVLIAGIVVSIFISGFLTLMRISYIIKK